MLRLAQNEPLQTEKDTTLGGSTCCFQPLVGKIPYTYMHWGLRKWPWFHCGNVSHRSLHATVAAWSPAIGFIRFRVVGTFFALGGALTTAKIFRTKSKFFSYDVSAARLAAFWKKAQTYKVAEPSLLIKKKCYWSCKRFFLVTFQVILPVYCSKWSVYLFAYFVQWGCLSCSVHLLYVFRNSGCQLKVFILLFFFPFLIMHLSL